MRWRGRFTRTIGMKKQAKRWRRLSDGTLLSLSSPCMPARFAKLSQREPNEIHHAVADCSDDRMGSHSARNDVRYTVERHAAQQCLLHTPRRFIEGNAGSDVSRAPAK